MATHLHAGIVGIAPDQDEHELPILILAFGEGEDRSEGTLVLAGRYGDMSLTIDSAGSLYPERFAVQHSDRRVVLRFDNALPVDQLGIEHTVHLHFDEQYADIVTKALAWFQGLPVERVRSHRFDGDELDALYAPPHDNAWG